MFNEEFFAVITHESKITEEAFKDLLNKIDKLRRSDVIVHMPYMFEDADGVYHIRDPRKNVKPDKSVPMVCGRMLTKNKHLFSDVIEVNNLTPASKTCVACFTEFANLVNKLTIIRKVLNDHREHDLKLKLEFGRLLGVNGYVPTN